MSGSGVARSRLDGPVSRGLAGVIAAAAIGLAAWLLYLEYRTDPRIAACVAKQTAAIRAARDKGALPAAAAKRFLARVEESCAAQAAR